MIGRIRGMLLEKQPPELLIETATGLAYEVQASMQTFDRLALLTLPQEIILYTYFIVREDSQQLYGFYEKQERALFKALLKVNGIGPKLALAILSSISVVDFIQAVYHGEIKDLTKLPGIGKKTAERLMIEMRDYVTHDQYLSMYPAESGHLNNVHKDLQDASSALLALGYKSPEVFRVLKAIDTKNLSVEALIRLALTKLS